MMGVHVGNSGTNKLYFVIDPSSTRDTGALVRAIGGSSYFNFWGWISANPETEKIEQNEFQELLWNEPLPQDEDLWESLFFSRATPLSEIIDPQLLVDIGGNKKPPNKQVEKQSLAKQIMGRGQNGER